MTFDQMRIGKFYHTSCNTVLCRILNSVNPLCCMYVHCIYTNKYYYYYNIVEEF